MSKNTNSYRAACCLLVASMMVFFAGCSGKSSTSQGEMPIVTNAVDNISDIELPSEMKW